MPSKAVVDQILLAGGLTAPVVRPGNWKLAIALMRSVRESLQDRIEHEDETLGLELTVLEQAISEAVRAEMARRSVH